MSMGAVISDGVNLLLDRLDSLVAALERIADALEAEGE